MTQSNWTTYWHPVRAAVTAELPNDHWLVARIAEQTALRDAERDERARARIDNGELDFYELRHRAITFMAEPRPARAGPGPPDIAFQVGHGDGGRLIEEVYIHRSPARARERIRDAMRRRAAEGDGTEPQEGSG